MIRTLRSRGVHTPSRRRHQLKRLPATRPLFFSAYFILTVSKYYLLSECGSDNLPTATRAGPGSEQAYRSAPPPHCPGPACPWRFGFRSWRCRYAAIEMYFSAKYIPGELWLAFKYVESGSGDPPALESSDEVVVDHQSSARRVHYDSSGGQKAYGFGV